MLELEASTPGGVKATLNFKDIMNLINVLHDKIIISKSKILNLQFTSPTISTLQMTASSNYKNSFYVFHSISFEGDFGNSPDVFLIYSEDDSEIKFDRKEKALMGDKISVNKLNRFKIVNNKYQYNLKEQLSYYSNKDSEYDIRPFIILVLGNKSIGLATIILVNKAFAKKVSSSCISGTIPFFGGESFVPLARKISWPLVHDLKKPLTVESLRETFWLEDKYIDSIEKLKKYIIKNFLNPKKQQAYKKKYLT